MEAWPIKALKAAPISRAECKNCSECKNLLETKKVARNKKSCQKVAEQLVASPNFVPILASFKWGRAFLQKDC